MNQAWKLAPTFNSACEGSKIFDDVELTIGGDVIHKTFKNTLQTPDTWVQQFSPTDRICQKFYTAEVFEDPNLTKSA